MTPLPKKRMAKSRTKTRKASISLHIPALTACPNCKGLRFPHRACPNCGYYGKKESGEEKKRPKT